MRATLHERLFAKVLVPSEPDGCWLWTGAGAGRQGRPQMRVATKVSRYVTSLTWEIYTGEAVPAGFVLDHVCGVVRCVNPEHLRPVTNKQNGEHRTRVNRNNRVGARGVFWDAESGKYRVQVSHNGRRYGGRHQDLDSAVAEATRLRAELFTHDDWSGR